MARPTAISTTPATRMNVTALMGRTALATGLRYAPQFERLIACYDEQREVEAAAVSRIRADMRRERTRSALSHRAQVGAVFAGGSTATVHGGGVPTPSADESGTRLDVALACGPVLVVQSFGSGKTGVPV